jgi:phosphatidate cytidylyltransferase
VLTSARAVLDHAVQAAQALVMAFIAGGAGTLGELVMRALKRDAGVRHWGNRSS